MALGLAACRHNKLNNRYSVAPMLKSIVENDYAELNIVTMVSVWVLNKDLVLIAKRLMMMMSTADGTAAKNTREA